MTFEVSHLDKFGNDINDEHPLNICFILVTFLVFHLDKSGNDINDSHPENMPFKFVTIIYDIENKLELTDNSLWISPKEEKFKSFNNEDTLLKAL